MPTVIWLLFALGLATVGGLVLAHRRSTARRLQRRIDLSQHLERIIGARGLDLTIGSPDAVDLVFRRADEAAEVALPWERIVTTGSAEELLDGLSFQLAWSAGAHDEPLRLNKQARDLAPLLIRRAWLDSFPPEASPPHTDLVHPELPSSGLTAIYRFISLPPLSYLSQTCLDDTGLDVEGLHAAMLALLRQRLDEEAVRGVVEGQGPLVLDDEESVSTSYLFLLPELLGAAEELAALVPSSKRLVVGRTDELAEMIRLQDDHDTGRSRWLLESPLHIDSAGCSVALPSAPEEPRPS